MKIDVITIFPKMFAPVINESIIKRAQKKGLVKIKIHDLRTYSKLLRRGRHGLSARAGIYGRGEDTKA